MTAIMTVATDGWVVTKRNLTKIKRVPDLVVFSTIQPIMFVLLFAYVFGGAISVPGVNYIDFLMAGIFTQTVTFGSTNTGIGLAEDLSKGIIDRFRSLPMSRSAVVFGRTASDVIYNVLSLVVMASAGVLVGWRFHNGFTDALLGFGLLLLFAYAISWIMAYVGLLVPSATTVRPTMMGRIPARSATELAPRMSSSAPTPRTTRPTISSRIAVKIGAWAGCVLAEARKARHVPDSVTSATSRIRPGVR